MTQTIYTSADLENKTAKELREIAKIALGISNFSTRERNYGNPYFITSCPSNYSYYTFTPSSASGDTPEKSLIKFIIQGQDDKKQFEIRKEEKRLEAEKKKDLYCQQIDERKNNGTLFDDYKGYDNNFYSGIIHHGRLYHKVSRDTLEELIKDLERECTWVHGIPEVENMENTAILKWFLDNGYAKIFKSRTLELHEEVKI